MNNEIWQQLLSLESRDVVQNWFNIIHKRKLNSRRAIEINAAAKQAREYFRNASNSSYSVRPLLSFYGVASLSRAILLLLKVKGGEETLTKGHGLETLGWKNVLSGKLTIGLSSLGDLKIQTTSGLFFDFLKETDNRISLHVRSSGVDWKLNYKIPEIGEQLTFSNLLARIPDLEKDYLNILSEPKYIHINNMSYSSEKGFIAEINAQATDRIVEAYKCRGYEINTNGKKCTLSSNTEVFSQNLPLFMHKYVHKAFGSIPHLYIVEPFEGNSNYSQLCITYFIAYFLGMLVRYYPTYWISLIQGEKGDSFWPIINRAQQLVETTYPELVIELIHDILNESKI